jgi:metal transporter CNNM
MDNLVWVGILLCLTQSAMFSGLNLAFFSLSRLRLEAEASTGNATAARILMLRRDSNFLLTTILWGNVGINVLLTLLSSSVLFGAAAFLFSTFVITFFGEIFPQAYFSRRAMKMASLLGPLLRFYQYLLYPVAKPSAWMLDKWLGREGVEYLRERQLRGVIEKHIESDSAEIDEIEGRGALNFLEIDDVPISAEGEPVDPASIIALPTTVDLPQIPSVESVRDPFVLDVNASGKKWAILADLDGQPQLVLDVDGYLRSVLMDPNSANGYDYCHRPIIVTNTSSPLGHIIGDLRKGMDPDSDAAIAKDIVLLWTPDEKRIVTGSDVLGRLLRGIGPATEIGDQPSLDAENAAQ